MSAPVSDGWTVAAVWLASIAVGAVLARVLLWVSAREAEFQRERELARFETTIRMAPRPAAFADALDD